MTKKTNSREVILDAAEAVILEMGAVHLSLDAVAQKAGVSKGGLLYNFPSKQALLKGMVTRLIDQYYADMKQEMAKFPVTAGQSLKASIAAGLGKNEHRKKIGRSMLAVLAHDKELLAPLREAFDRQNEDIRKSGLPLARAEILSLATDGVMFRELLGVVTYSPAKRRTIIGTMMQMIHELEEKT